MALTSVNRLIPVACACLSSLISGAWAAVTAADLARAAALPAAVRPAWDFMITITGSSTFRGSVAARAVAGAPKSDQAASAGTPPSRAEAVARHRQHVQDPALRHALLVRGNGGPSGRDAWRP